MAETAEQGSGKTRKRQAVKAATRQGTEKVKATIHLSREADQRLNIHCAMTGLDRSALVEKLINAQLRRYVVSDRGANEATGEDAAE